MKTIRFIFAIAELFASQAILSIYGLSAWFATLRLRRHAALDFSPQLR